MIGRPENDLRHTGHIGYDGITFGDIPSIGKDPVQNIIPIKGGSGETTLSSEYIFRCFVFSETVYYVSTSIVCVNSLILEFEGVF